MSIAEQKPWAIDAASYHADKSKIGRSMLDDFRYDPAYYHARYITKTIPDSKPTPAMLLGTLVHLLVLQPDQWETIAIAPQCDKRTKDGKALWAEFCEKSVGKLIVDAETHFKAKTIATAVLAHPLASKLLAMHGPTEWPICWTDEETGLDCKALVDKHGRPDLGIDLKTTSDPSPEQFAKSCASFRYHGQAAHYLDGLHAVTGERHTFAFVAVGTSAPFTVAIYELSDEAVAIGREQNRAALAGIAECLRTGDWTPPYSSQTNILDLPRWAQNESQWRA